MCRDIIRGWKIMLSSLVIKTQEEVLYEIKSRVTNVIRSEVG